jgi:FKBP-type peptidyl-prolyl cis-trans isomerase
MKLNRILTLCLLALGLAGARAEDAKITVPGLTDKPAAPASGAAAAPAPSFTDAQLLEEFGWFIGKRVGLSELDFNPKEVDSFIKGLQIAASGKDAPYELEKAGPLMDEMLQKKQSVFAGKIKDKNMADNVAFFTKLKDNKNVVELPDGLRYEIVKQGDGAMPKPDDTVKVHYTGALIDGTVFDSSVQRGEPLDIQLSQTVPGWIEGLQKLQKGGKMKLYIPPQLGYGDEGNQRIPPASALVFDVELLDVKATPAAAPQIMPQLPEATKK